MTPAQFLRFLALPLNGSSLAAALAVKANDYETAIAQYQLAELFCPAGDRVDVIDCARNCIVNVLAGATEHKRLTCASALLIACAHDELLVQCAFACTVLGAISPCMS